MDEIEALYLESCLTDTTISGTLFYNLKKKIRRLRSKHKHRMKGGFIMSLTILLLDGESSTLSDIVSVEEWNWTVALSKFDN